MLGERLLDVTVQMRLARPCQDMTPQVVFPDTDGMAGGDTERPVSQ